MSFGIWPSSMRWTWPSHRSLSRVYILGRPALDRISALDTLSCQDIPRIRRMLLRWKGLGAVAVDGAPWRSTDSGRCRQRNCDLQLTGGAAIGGPEGAQASFPHSTPRPRTSGESTSGSTTQEALTRNDKEADDCISQSCCCKKAKVT
ncbi:uncharacterized protein LOC144601032 isoform X3 [Rhinoraja longicauda]